MKLIRKDFRVFKDYIFILPAIALDFNNQIYAQTSFAIEFRWLVFHARLVWLRGDTDADCD